MPPAIAAAAIGAAGAVGSAVIGSNAAKKAASTQQQAAQQATNTQLQMYNQTRDDLAPYLHTGTSALSSLAGMFGIGAGGPNARTAGMATSALTQYPGYQFGLDQGVQALDRSAASRGLLLSGGQMKDITEFGQQYGLQQGWQPYLSQLGQIATTGENAGAQTGTLGANAAAGAAQSQLAGGTAAASGQVGSANAITGGIQSGLNNALLGYQLSRGGGGAPVSPLTGMAPLGFNPANTNIPFYNPQTYYGGP